MILLLIIIAALLGVIAILLLSIDDRALFIETYLRKIEILLHEIKKKL